MIVNKGEQMKTTSGACESPADHIYLWAFRPAEGWRCVLCEHRAPANNDEQESR